MPTCGNAATALRTAAHACNARSAHVAGVRAAKACAPSMACLSSFGARSCARWKGGTQSGSCRAPELRKHEGVRSVAMSSRLAPSLHLELRAEQGHGFARSIVLRAGTAAHCLARSRQATRSATVAKAAARRNVMQQRATPVGRAMARRWCCSDTQPSPRAKPQVHSSFSRASRFCIECSRVPTCGAWLRTRTAKRSNSKANSNSKAHTGA